jgi:hypothetical protein
LKISCIFVHLNLQIIVSKSLLKECGTKQQKEGFIDPPFYFK